MYNRKSIRLQNYNYSGGGIYFVTILTKDRKCCLSEIKDYGAVLLEPGKIVDRFWNELTIRYQDIILDEYIVMPNHLHGIICIAGDEAIHELPLQNTAGRRKMMLSKMVGYFKMNSAKEINTIQGSAGSPFWHRNYFERIIRNEKELNNVRQYIHYNPAKWQMDYENPENYIESDEKLKTYYNSIWSKGGDS